MDYERARRAMVVGQLRSRGIRDRRVLDVMASVPREEFVPPEHRAQAYCDSALGIGQGQTISQPYMVALMTEALHLEGHERVLEVGTGSGYQAAVLAELAAHLYTVERVAVLSESARKLLAEELGYTNISFSIGDGTLGWPEQAPFDGIMVTAGAPHRPGKLLEQLAADGEAVVPVGPRYYQTLTHYHKRPNGRIDEREMCECVFVKLIGEDAW